MHYVIIGSSAAGISCIESLREVDKEGRITLIGDEQPPLYSRCLLSYFLAGTINEANLFFKKKRFFEENNVEAVLGVRAEAIDLRARTITTSAKKKIPYDRLLLATGASSLMPDIPGIERHNIFCFRTIRDVKAIEGALKKTRQAVILGGGLIGLRAAFALNARGIIVRMVTGSGQLLSEILEPQAAGFIQERVEAKGITVFKGAKIKEILGEHSVVSGLLLNDGTSVECELVIVGNEARPNIGLAKEAGIAVGRGIVVNDYLETSAEDIFSAGDVSETRDVSSGETILSAIWPRALEQGRIAGENMAGKHVKYEGIKTEYSVEFFGLPITTKGIIG